MKKNQSILYIIIFCLFLAIQTEPVSAQVIELNAFTGYQFGGKIKFYEGEFKINDAQNFGAKLAYGLSSTTFVELSYMRMDTEGQWRPYRDEPENYIGLSSNYIHVAGLQQLEYGRVSPYATLGLGVAWFAPKTNEYKTSTQLSATFGAGLKIWLSDMIGIRLQGSMLMPMIFEGFGLGCGIGTGGASCGGGAYTRITPFQGEFSGGLIIKISPN